MPDAGRSGIVVTPEGYGLCFVDDSCWAYFANVPPADVWGDDWNDAPHDCNAGRPYDKEGQRLVQVAFDGPYEVAGTDDRGRWGYLSAEDINTGRAPWLYDPGYGEKTYPEPKDVINAGITLQEFRKRIRAAGGQVYEVRR